MCYYSNANGFSVEVISMNDGRLRNLVRGAILLALAVVLQGMRLIIPVPTPISMFLIGSAVNACLVLIARTTGRTQGVTAAVLLLGWRECCPCGFSSFPLWSEILFSYFSSMRQGDEEFTARLLSKPSYCTVLFLCFYKLLKFRTVSEPVSFLS